jgi:hypothetical protein
MTCNGALTVWTLLLQFPGSWPPIAAYRFCSPYVPLRPTSSIPQVRTSHETHVHSRTHDVRRHLVCNQFYARGGTSYLVLTAQGTGQPTLANNRIDAYDAKQAGQMWINVNDKVGAELEAQI